MWGAAARPGIETISTVRGKITDIHTPSRTAAAPRSATAVATPDRTGVVRRRSVEGL
jgi:hypothetical protein